MRGRVDDEEASVPPASAEASPTPSPAPESEAAPLVEVSPPDGKKRVKGYAWVEEVVPNGQGHAHGANGVNGVASEPMEVDA